MTATSTPDPDLVADLSATVRSVCDRLGGTERARRRIDDGAPGHDADAWGVLAHQVGVGALGLPESAGGLGGVPEILAVAEVLGGCLLPVPFLTSTAMAGQVLGRCGDDDVLQRLVGGEIAAVVAPGMRVGSDGIDVIVADGHMSGAWSFVPGATEAALVVVAHGGRLWLVDTAADGVALAALPTLDLASNAASLVLERAPVVELGSDSLAQEVRPVALASIAADQLGGASACLAMTIEYLKSRVQFGRPVGSFQAVKHTVADMLVKVELARSAVRRCADAAPGRSLAEAALVAHLWCSDAYRYVTAEAVQLHGGIGFTWEHDAHLYFRRARADALLTGTASQTRQELADLLDWR